MKRQFSLGFTYKLNDYKERMRRMNEDGGEGGGSEGGQQGGGGV
jgi:hypothetical protein